MKKIYILFTLFCLSHFCNAQTLSAPVPQQIYGGTVGDIEVWSFDPDSVYLVISTESANSLFYSKASRAGNLNNVNWTALPSADIDDGYGDLISNIEIHQSSNTIFFLHQSNVYSTDFTSTSANLVDSMVKEFIILGDTMFLVKNNLMPSGMDTLEFGPINSSGIYSSTNGISLLKTYNDPPQIIRNPFNDYIYIFDRGSSPHLYVLLDPYYSMTNSSILNSVLNPAPIITNVEWRTYGFAEDGTWYVAGQPPLNNPNIVDRHIAWTNTNGAVWNYDLIDIPGPAGGVVGSNMIIEDLISNRNIFIGNAVLTDTSSMNNWNNPGTNYIHNFNRANDGYTKADPIYSDMKYHSTNIGMGYSTSNGDSIFGWNNGLEAVQVNDLDMNAGFTIGWVASKSGIRNVTDYNTATELWSNTHFPDGDGAPYYAVSMDPNNDSIVFVGNQRVYKTTSSGYSSSPSFDGWDQVFTPENPPYNFNSINSYCTSLAVSADNSSVIAAGYKGTFGDKGGLFYSLDGGSNWDQLLLISSIDGQDVNVLDIEFTFENSNVVLYIGLESDPMTSGAYGLFRAELISGVWSLARDGSYGATDAIVDIQTNVNRDTLIFLNTDPGILPINNIHMKDILSGTWLSSITGPSAGGYGTAITMGDGYIFMAINEDIHTVPVDFSMPWNLAYAYPEGTDVNVLFYDELLVGTGTGLYAQELDLNTIGIIDQNQNDIYLYPNPADKKVYFSKNHSVRVFNIAGELIYQSLIPVNNLFTETWNSGIYIIVFDNNERRKIMIVR